MCKPAVADIAMMRKRRNEIKMSGSKIVRAGRHYNTRLTLNHKIQSGERTMYILPIPVRIMPGKTDIQRQQTGSFTKYHTYTISLQSLKDTPVKTNTFQLTLCKYTQMPLIYIK